MNECKHTWRIYKDGINCLKCTISIINVLADRERKNAELSAKIGQLELQVAVMRVALEKALYDLTTSHNLLATDRPDLMPKPDKDITWMTDNSKSIDAILKALKEDKP